MPYLERPGVRLFFDDTGGDGHPVITTHGFIENGSYWGRTGVSAGLAEAGFRVVDLDMRGHGRSVGSVPAPDYSEQSVIADIGALADALGFDRFHLLTHATGSMAGARFAMENSHRLLSLVSTSAASSTAPDDDQLQRALAGKDVPPLLTAFGPATAMAAILRDRRSFHAVIDDVQADLEGHPLGVFFKGFAANADPARCWSWLRDIFSAGNPLSCADFAEQFFGDPDPRLAALRQINCPSLVIVGEQDDFLLESSRVLAEHVPGGQLLVMEGVGHMTAIEAPTRTLQHILQFLTS